jgi:hypothetical protein
MTLNIFSHVLRDLKLKNDNINIYFAALEILLSGLNWELYGSKNHVVSKPNICVFIKIRVWDMNKASTTYSQCTIQNYIMKVISLWVRS